MSEGYQPSPQELGLNKKESAGEISPLHKLHKIEDGEAESILSRLEIRGSRFHDQELQKSDLLDAGLEPRYKTDVDGKAVWFSSSAYALGGGRDAVVAYVEKDGRFIPRAYYRSNSQGLWRYMPSYRESGGHISWYSKGYGESSITLPTQTQQVLAELTEDRQNIIAPKDPEFIFAGMTRNMQDTVSYRDEVRSQPDYLDGNFYPKKSGKIPPEQVRFQDPAQSPDFSASLVSWEQESSVYGKIQIEAYASKNGRFKYMFCRDQLGRAWIGGIEDDSRVTSTGLRESWIDGGDLTTPAYEYDLPEADQTGGYGNKRLSHGPYSDMFENYVSKIPVIQEYLKIKEAFSELEKPPTIESSKNLDDLYQALSRIEGLQGSKTYYRSDELKEIIDRVRQGNLPIEYITSTGGLRRKVAEILGKNLL